MGANISVYPIIHSHRVDKSGRVAIKIRIDLDSSPVAYTNVTDRVYKIPKQYWDSDKKRVRKDHPNAAMLNNAIDVKVAELDGLFLLKEKTGMKLTKKNVKALVQGNDPGKCFIEFSAKQIEEKYDSSETKRTYKSELTKLQEYTPEVSFRDIDFEFLQSYAAWMRDVRGNSPNTIWKTFKFMNTMMNDAIKVGGIIETNPFDVFDRGRYKQTKRGFLTKTERPKMEKLLNEPIPEELAKVVAYMLFMCYCGLRFEDALSFDYDTHIVDDERLIMMTSKKDVLVNIKLFPKLREVIMFIKDRPLKIANKEFNSLLRVAGTMAGVSTYLTAHVGRHTFGRILAENNIPKEHAQKLLGHRDRRSTDIYYHMLDTDVDAEVDSKLGNI